MRPFTRRRLAAVTAMTMAIGTFPFTVFSVLGPELIEEFGISRAQLGALATATGLVGALSAPYWGRVTDRRGAIESTRLVLGVGTITLLWLALAPTYLLLFAASLTTGIANGWSNAATNSLIVDTVPAGERGIVTGIKQSGVQIGTFLGGALLPLLTVLWGWRPATAIFVILPLLGLALMAGRRVDRHETRVEWGNPVLPAAVRRVAVYGAISGLATSAMFAFLPLFAEEDQGWDATQAGVLIAIVGFLGIGARITWPTVSERRFGYGRSLSLISLISTGGAVLLACAAADVAPSWVMVPAAVLLASGSIAWNAVGMVAVMDLTPKPVVGKATGVVLLGFLLGFSLGSPLMGMSVDVFGTYVPGWVGAAVLLAVSAVIALRIPSGSTLPAR